MIVSLAWGGLRVAPLRSAHARATRAPSHHTQESKAMTSTTMSASEAIRALNDAFRRTFVGGMVMITAGVQALPRDERRSLLAKVRAFEAFGEDNDPHGEHDFGAVNEAGIRYFWKLRVSTTAPPNSARPTPLTPPSPPAS